MTKTKKYSVSQVSKLTGVTVKTLHHYDEKGLLVAHRNLINDYREYDQNHLVKLQQILIYRELDFSIEQIKGLVNCNGSDLLKALSEQKQMLINRQQTINKMINSIEVTMTNMKGKDNYDILFEDIPKEKVERWDKMTRERHGDEHIDKEREVFGKIEVEKMKAIKEETTAITEEFAKTIGKPVDDELVQAITQKHYDSLNNIHLLLQQIQGVAKEQHKALDFDSYVAMANSVDEQEVNELCEHYGEGYAEHARCAMIYFAEKHLKK